MLELIFRLKKLIVTASSKTKRKTDESSFTKSNNTFYDSLSDKSKKSFFNARSIILNEFNFDEGPDTHSTITKDTSQIYLPAYKRYAGRTFSKVSSEAWNQLNSHIDKLDCVILSAYYGLIRFNEPIRDYTIKQVTKMNSGQEIGKFWRDQGAQEWLYDYIKKNKFEEVKFVLSTSYSDIVGKEELMRILQDDLGISSEDKQFKQGGMKSMLLRGQYINDFLLKSI
jgi:cytoplasmic iron level regulating protein YaaA (DUF328/UPF0246 family)